MTNLRKILITNKLYATKLCKEMSSIAFSEDCKTSKIHQLVHSLSSILKSIHYEDKVSAVN